MAVKGVVVAIQETHWDPAAEQAWEALLPDTRIVSTGATVGPRGGPQGGVALVIPREHELLEWKVLKEGCGVAAKIRRKGEEEHGWYISAYAPPEHQLSTVKDIARNAKTAVEEDGGGGGGHRVLLGGDLNCDLNGPRHDKERKDGEAIQE